MSRRTDALETPADLLGRRLQRSGLALQATRLRDVIPDEVSGDEHLQLMRQVLISLTEDIAVPPEFQAEAERLLRVANNLQKALGRCGTVYVAWISSHRRRLDETGDYTCYWDQAPDGEPAFLEQGPQVSGLDIVREWAHARSDSVYVRPAWAPETAFWAGAPALRPNHIEPLRDPST